MLRRQPPYIVSLSRGMRCEGGIHCLEVFLDVIGTKNLQTFCSTLYTVTSISGFYSPHGFFGFLQQQLKVVGVLAWFTLYLCLPWKVAMFFLIQRILYYTLIIYKYRLLQNSLRSPFIDKGDSHGVFGFPGREILIILKGQFYEIFFP